MATTCTGTASTSPPGSKRLAEPGGIVLSAAAFDQVSGKLPVAFRDLGERSLKNIARPVHVYAIGGPPTRRSPAYATPMADRGGERRDSLVIAAVVGRCRLGLAGEPVRVPGRAPRPVANGRPSPCCRSRTWPIPPMPTSATVDRGYRRRARQVRRPCGDRPCRGLHSPRRPRSRRDRALSSAPATSSAGRCAAIVNGARDRPARGSPDRDDPVVGAIRRAARRTSSRSRMTSPDSSPAPWPCGSTSSSRQRIAPRRRTAWRPTIWYCMAEDWSARQRERATARRVRILAEAVGQWIPAMRRRGWHGPAQFDYAPQRLDRVPGQMLGRSRSGRRMPRWRWIPTSPAPYGLLGNVYISASSSTSALAELDRALAANPSDAEATSSGATC